MALPETKRGTKPSHPVSLGRPRARMDAGAYDRGPLTAAEALEVERYEAAIRAKGGRWRVSGLRGALPRLVEPVLDAVDTLHFVPERLVKPEELWRREARAHVLSAMVRGMHGTGIAYWSWKEEEWRLLVQHPPMVAVRLTSACRERGWRVVRCRTRRGGHPVSARGVSARCGGST